MAEYVSPPEREAPGQPAGPGRGRRGGWLPLLLVLLLASACAGLYAALTARSAPSGPAPDPGPETFFFGSRELEALEGVARNEYDAAAFSLDERGRVTYAGEGVSVRTGVDVSAHQGEIDWEAVAGDGIDFAMLRLGYRGYTEGGLYPDSCFQQNLRGALDAGLEVGVYFFSQAVSEAEALEEADFVLSALEEAGVRCPVAYDWEFITPGEGARTDGMDGDTLTACALAFCGRVEEGGCSPMIYFNKSLGYLTYDLSRLTDYPFWLAEYDAAPEFFYHFDLWQYSNRGAVAGVQGDVDLNLSLRRETA